MNTEKIPLHVNNKISETLYFPLLMRSMETQRTNPIIDDPAACRIIERIDYRYPGKLKSEMSKTGVSIRVRYFDNLTREFIHKHERPVVVMIGCGLDTRTQRLGAGAQKAHFYLLDLPPVIELRSQLLPAAPNEHFIAQSMFDSHWRKMLKAEEPNSKFLFLAEGVFMYFKETEIKEFIKNLSDDFPGSELHFDMVNRTMQKAALRRKASNPEKAVFEFGTNDDKFAEKLTKNIKHIKTRLFTEEKNWNRIGLLAWISRIIPQFRTAFKMLSYRI